MAGTHTNRYLAQRPMVLGLAKILFLGLSQLPLIQAAPYHVAHIWAQEEADPMPAGDPNLWLYLGISAFLVLLGGAFAGLTIALMGQVRTCGSGLHLRHTDRFPRMRSICKSFVIRAKGQRLSTLRLSSNCFTRESTGCLLRYF